MAVSHSFACAVRARRFTNIKPSKTLGTIWKSLAKYFAGLHLEEADFQLHIADQSRAVSHTWEHGLDSACTLSQAFELLPAGESELAAQARENGRLAPGVHFLTLYYSLAPLVNERIVQQLQQQAGGGGGSAVLHERDASPPASACGLGATVTAPGGNDRSDTTRTTSTEATASAPPTRSPPRAATTRLRETTA